MVVTSVESQLCGRLKSEDCSLRPYPGKNMKTYLKNKVKQKRAGGMAQVVEYLPSKDKAYHVPEWEVMA
jgi:hypothetical protein